MVLLGHSDVLACLKDFAKIKSDENFESVVNMFVVADKV